MEIYLSNEALHDELERLKGENYHLKRQLRNKNNLVNGQKNYIRKLEKELKAYTGNVQHYKNGKRDNYKRGVKKR